MPSINLVAAKTKMRPCFETLTVDEIAFVPDPDRDLALERRVTHLNFPQNAPS